MKIIGTRQNRTDVFWGEISPCEHLVEVYDEHDALLDTLEGFVTGGLNDGESVILIARPSTLEALEVRLWNSGVDFEAARMGNRYIALDAEEVLTRFMVREWPDEERFVQTVTELVKHARAGGRKVRAFGEMVACLWAKGLNGATVRLEHLWQEVCKREAFALLCAYPRSSFTEDAGDSISAICAAHSMVLAG